MSIFKPRESIAETIARSDAARTAVEMQRKVADEAKLAEWIAEDEGDRVLARHYVAPVTVEHGQSGPFLVCGKVELALRFVESITVPTPGHRPFMMPMMYIGTYPERGRASICITMQSGQKHSVDCSRWHVDMLLAALQSAWRANR